VTYRQQVSISDKKHDELIALAERRGVQPGALARMMLSDQIELEVRSVRQTDATWSKYLAEIALRYSAR
jgi:hypothetical protein